MDPRFERYHEQVGKLNAEQFKALQTVVETNRTEKQRVEKEKLVYKTAVADAMDAKVPLKLLQAFLKVTRPRLYQIRNEAGR